jgi:hypothetical protein
MNEQVNEVNGAELDMPAFLKRELAKEASAAKEDSESTTESPKAE